MSTASSANKRYRFGNSGRSQHRHIALDVDHDFYPAAWIELAKRLEHPIRAGGVIGARHYGTAARFLHGRLDLRRIGCDHNRTDRRRVGTAQHMLDHRLSGDLGQRLARQPGSPAYASRNKNPRTSAIAWANPPHLRRLYGLQDARQTGYLCVVPSLCRRGAIQR